MRFSSKHARQGRNASLPVADGRIWQEPAERADDRVLRGGPNSKAPYTRNTGLVGDLLHQRRLPNPWLSGDVKHRWSAWLLGVEKLLDLRDLLLASHKLPAEDLADPILDSETLHELVGGPLPQTRLALECAHDNPLEIRWDLFPMCSR